MSIRRPLLVAIATATAFIASAAHAAQLTVHKSPYCGCCAKWIEHVEKHGFTEKVVETEEMAAVKKRLGVPEKLASCHTSMTGGYFIEGHVPASDIKRLLKENKDVAGLAVPGMPMGSPGMDGPRKAPYDVLTFRSGGKTSVYSNHNQ